MLYWALGDEFEGVQLEAARPWRVEAPIEVDQRHAFIKSALVGAVPSGASGAGPVRILRPLLP